jgi:hypothetical protein
MGVLRLARGSMILGLDGCPGRGLCQKREGSGSVKGVVARAVPAASVSPLAGV